MRSVIVVSSSDNVATALEPIDAGRSLAVGSRAVTTAEAIPAGHKVALVAIAEGEPVVKYGSAIGHATRAIAAGAHVHTHNVSSARGRGDLAGGAKASGPDPRANVRPSGEPE